MRWLFDAFSGLKGGVKFLDQLKEQVNSPLVNVTFRYAPLVTASPQTTQTSLMLPGSTLWPRLKKASPRCWDTTSPEMS